MHLVYTSSVLFDQLVARVPCRLWLFALTPMEKLRMSSPSSKECHCQLRNGQIYGDGQGGQFCQCSDCGPIALTADDR